MQLHRLSLSQGVDLWSDLVTAYYGLNGFGGDVAEIYVFRCMPHSPTVAAMPDSPDALEEIRQANKTLCDLLALFAESWSADIHVRIDNQWVLPDPETMAPNGHRWQVQVRPRQEARVDGETPSDASAFSRFHTYMRAFKAGAGGSALGEWHELAQNHADPSIRSAWTQGYADGRAAKQRASSRATELYGHTPSILRTQEI